MSQTVNVAAGSSAPLIATTSPLAAVGVPVRVIVIVTEERVPEALPCHSSKSILVVAKPERFEVSNVIPVAEGGVEVETVTVSGFTLTTRRIESGLEVVESPVIVNVVPEVHVPVFIALALPSIAGPEPIAILVSTVEVEAVPEVVDSPLHSVPQVPTVVLFVKKV